MLAALAELISEIINITLHSVARHNDTTICLFCFIVMQRSINKDVIVN